MEGEDEILVYGFSDLQKSQKCGEGSIVAFLKTDEQINELLTNVNLVLTYTQRGEINRAASSDIKLEFIEELADVSELKLIVDNEQESIETGLANPILQNDIIVMNSGGDITVPEDSNLICAILHISFLDSSVKSANLCLEVEFGKNSTLIEDN